MSVPLDPDSPGFLIGDLSRLMRAEIERRIGAAGLGVTAGEGRALANLARAGEVRQNVLAERMGVEAMTLSSYLDRLEARGLVTRRVDPADRRAKLVSVTEAADSVLEEIRLIGRALKADMSQSFGPGEWDAAMRAMKAMRDALQEMRACGSSREGRAA